ncbi:MAG: HDOD domain-containing protein [Pirellulales bacterium]|nr:HDOD domain-containing protein [Pirellulales bacterium]
MTAKAKQTSINLKELVLNAQLPALPQSAIQLMQLSKDPDNGPQEFSVPIEADPGLTSQVLRFVNSSYFGFSREISTVKLAITLVGIRTIKNFALWSAVFSLIPNPQCGPLDVKKLWQDSLRRALFARSMGKLLGLNDAEEAFAAALLQDMALPLIAKEIPGRYEELLNERHEKRCRLSLLEQHYFGWTHAEAAARIAKRWNLPDEFGRLIARHTDPALLRMPHDEDLSAVAVALSALLPTSLEESWYEREALEASYFQLSGRLAPPILEMLSQVDQDFADFGPILEMTSPPQTLVELFLQDRNETPFSVIPSE